MTTHVNFETDKLLKEKGFDNNYVQQNLMGYNSITEAYEAAITYVLNNLI